MPNPAGSMVNDIIATVLPSYSKKIIDQIGNNNALVNSIKKRGNIIEYTAGGVSIIETLSYAENGTYQRYDGYDLLNVTPQQTITEAEFDPKQIALSISISGKEERQNRGSHTQIHNLITERIKNMMTSFENNFDIDLHSDGAGYGGKQISGLRAFLSKTPTVGTIGGINRADFAFWRNNALNAQTHLGAVPTSQTIVQAMNALFMKLTYGAETPDLIIADDVYYGLYENSLQGLQRIATNNSADAGYSSLKYKQKDFVLGGGAGSVMPVNTMYFVNSNYVKYKHYTKTLLEQISKNASYNQDATVHLYGHMGNMTFSNLRKQGVLYH